MNRRFPRQGIVLMLTVGILTLLSLSGVILVQLTGRLRGAAALVVDNTAARLLARSGVEYAAARMFYDGEGPEQATHENQADDWRFRDDPNTPLEKALNPSWARTEPYRDVYPVAGALAQDTGNGRYDHGFDPYTDLDGNGRFDAASGRLRGGRGIGRRIFLLKVAAGGADSATGNGGGINVNGGFWGDPGRPDVNGNQVDDWRDLDTQADNLWPGYNPYIDGPFWLNWKLADLINKTASYAGIASAQAATLQSPIMGPAVPGEALGMTPGYQIVLNRPQAGYRDLDHVRDANRFLPGDWERLKPHLTTIGRRNPCAIPLNFEGSRRYLVDAALATREVLTAAFDRCGTNQKITTEEARKAADLIRQGGIAGFYDLFVEFREAGIFGDTKDFFGATYPTKVWKALVAVAMARPKDDQRGRTENDAGADWHHWSFLAYDLPYDDLWHLQSARSKWFWGGPTLELSLGSRSIPPRSYDVQSLGQVQTWKGALRAACRFDAAASSGKSLGVWTQDDFERPPRPYRDRMTSHPLFSRAACPDLDPRSPVLDLEIACGSILGSEVSVLYRYGRKHILGYDKMSGWLMLADRCWIDPEAVFYLPQWDLDQPERPPVDRRTFSFTDNFDDVMGKPKPAARALGDGEAQRKSCRTAKEKSVLRNVYVSDQDIPGTRFCTPTGFALPDYYDYFDWDDSGQSKKSPSIHFPVKRADNAARFPLLNDQGVVDRATLVGWGPVGFVRQDNPMDVVWDGIACRIPSGTGSVDLQSPSPPALPDLCSIFCVLVFNGIPDDSGTDPYAELYLNGVWQSRVRYELRPLDPLKNQMLSSWKLFHEEFRMYKQVLNPGKIQAMADRGYYWTADPSHENPALHETPSFTSNLYRSSGSAVLDEIGWDGFVPLRVRDAVDARNQNDPGEPRHPLLVKLILYGVQGTPIAEVPLPPESWRTGGCRILFSDLWKASYPDRSPPRTDAFSFKVWMDVSMSDLALQSPVFDSIEIGYKQAGPARRFDYLRER